MYLNPLSAISLLCSGWVLDGYLPVCCFLGAGGRGVVREPDAHDPYVSPQPVLVLVGSLVATDQGVALVLAGST